MIRIHARESICFPVVALLSCASFLLLYLYFDSVLLSFVILSLGMIYLLLAHQEVGVYICLFSSMFFHPLDAQKIPVGGSNIRFLDILVVVFITGWAIQFAQGKSKVPQDKQPRLLYLILVLLMFSLVRGVVRGHNLLTVLRDARAIAYYSSALAFASVLIKPNQLKRLVKYLMIFSVGTLAYYYLMRILNAPFESGLSYVTLTSNRYIRSYGIYSSWPFFAFAFFMLVSRITVMRPRGPVRILMWLLTGAFVYAILLLLMRTYFVGLVVGSMVIIVAFALQKGRRFAIKLAVTCTIVSLVLVVIIGFAPDSNLRRHPFFERYLSIFSPKVTTHAAAVTRQDRIDAILYFQKFQKGSSWLGTGLGEVQRDEQARFYLFHSSMGWALYRLGILSTLVLYLIFGCYMLIALKRSPEIADPDLQSIYYALLGFAAFLLALSPASGVLFDKINEMILLAFSMGGLMVIPAMDRQQAIPHTLSLATYD